MITLCRERRASESIQNILDAGTANLESSSRSRRAIEVNIYCTEDGWKDFFFARENEFQCQVRVRTFQQ